MVILLDTHIFLWWLFDDPHLSDSLRKQIQNMDTTIFVSAASVWEIATKYRIGKLPEAQAVAADVPKWIVKAGFHSMAIKPEHAQMAGMWDVPAKTRLTVCLLPSPNSKKCLWPQWTKC